MIVAGQDDAAIDQLQKTIAMDPNFDLAHWFLGQAYEDKGRLAEAIQEYEKAMQLNSDPTVLASLARAHVLAGDKEIARKMLADLTNQSKQRYVPAYPLRWSTWPWEIRMSRCNYWRKSTRISRPSTPGLRQHQDRPKTRWVARRPAFRRTGPEGDERVRR